MIVTHKAPKAFTISDVDVSHRIDPVTVYLDDHEPGKGTLTVRCYDRAWTCYWGGMGDGRSLERFIRSVDAGYISNSLIRGNRGGQLRAAERRDEAYVERIARAIKDAIARGAASTGAAS